MRPLQFLLKRVFSSPCICLLRQQSTAVKRQVPRTRPAHRTPLDSGGILLLAVPITTFCLGVWQIQRRNWKLVKIAELEEKTTLPPVPLPENLEDIEALEYRRVKVRGTFDHTREIRMSPKSNVHPELFHGESGGAVISSGQQSGCYIVTPFKLADRDTTILVNRGWIPKKGKAQISFLKPESQIKGEIELVGIVRTPEQRLQFTPKNDPSTNYWAHRDIEQMAEAVGTDPIFIDATLDSSVEGGPIAGQTIVTLRNHHGEYVVTWFSISLLTAFIWYKRYYSPSASKLLIDMYKQKKVT